MNRRVLLVDDEPAVLESLRRQLAGAFDVVTAPGPREGLEHVRRSPPFATVVSDMRMPGMTGVEFLEEVRGHCPESVRMILTSHADLESTMAAVNLGLVFRFLTRPCRSPDLVTGIQACVDQYELVASRRILLEQTLHGTVQLLTEILALTNPAAQRRANRIARHVEKICAALAIPIPWQLRIALLLSQIGCITLPEEILARMQAGQPLSDEAQALYRSHPGLAAKLLAGIPRLEIVAAIVARQIDAVPVVDAPAALHDWDAASLGGMLLKIATDLEHALAARMPRQRAIRQVALASPQFPGDLRKLLESLDLGDRRTDKASIGVAELRTGMVLDEDLFSTDGMMLLAKGNEVTRSILLRIQAVSRGIGVTEPFRVGPG